MKLPSRVLLVTPVLAVAIAAACAPPSGGGGAVHGGSSGGAVDTLYAGDEDQIPCAPRAVLKAVCQQCHTRPATSGAPFPLQGHSDVLRTYGGSVIRELMIEQLEAERMPLSPVTIESEDRATLLTWLRAGAPAVPAQSCATDGGASFDASTTADAPSFEPDAADGDASDDGGGGVDDLDAGL